MNAQVERHACVFLKRSPHSTLFRFGSICGQLDTSATPRTEPTLLASIPKGPRRSDSGSSAPI